MLAAPMLAAPMLVTGLAALLRIASPDAHDSMMHRPTRALAPLFAGLLGCLQLAPAVVAQDRMPEANVVDVPAIGEGLCVHNLFQSHMVVQREQAIRVSGWAAPGEPVAVASAGERRTTTAARDRSW